MSERNIPNPMHASVRSSTQKRKKRTLVLPEDRRVRREVVRALGVSLRAHRVRPGSVRATASLAHEEIRTKYRATIHCNDRQLTVMARNCESGLTRTASPTSLQRSEWVSHRTPRDSPPCSRAPLTEARGSHSSCTGHSSRCALSMRPSAEPVCVSADPGKGREKRSRDGRCGSLSRRRMGQG